MAGYFAVNLVIAIVFSLLGLNYASKRKIKN
jgi:hypothetical protein